MPNSLGTIASGEIIVREALRSLLTEFPVLQQTARQSSETLRFNQSAVFHLVSTTTAQDYSPTNGYVASDATMVSRAVQINKHKHVTVQFTDQERTASEVDLVARFAPVIANAVGKALYDDLFALVNATNFSASLTDATVDRATLIDLAQILNAANVPSDNRYAVLNPASYASLFKDASIVSVDFRTQKDVESGVLSSTIHGFRVSQYSALPTAGNLIGFAAHPEALLVATTVPDVPADAAAASGMF